MDKCECDKCKYCLGLKSTGATRAGFQCKHPNQNYINDYFAKKGIRKMPGFIGYGEAFSNVPTNKTTPKWCPLKVETK